MSDGKNNVQVIIECGPKDKQIKSLGQVVCDLPFINSYVLQIKKENLPKLTQMKRVTFYQAAKITAQHEGVLKNQ